MWQLRRNAHAILTDEGGAILNERTGRWTYLTPTAAAALMLLLSGNTEEQAAQQYATRYRLTPGPAAQEVRTVTDALCAQALLHPGPTPPPRRRRRRWTR